MNKSLTITCGDVQRFSRDTSKRELGYTFACRDLGGLVGIKLEIFPERNLVIRTVEGPVDPEDYKTAINEQFDDQRFVQGMDIVWDLRGATGGQWTTQTSQDLARYMRGQKDRRGDGRFAIVVGSDLSFGLARQYQNIGHHVSPAIGVFRSLDAALRWLQEATSE